MSVRNPVRRPALISRSVEEGGVTIPSSNSSALGRTTRRLSEHIRTPLYREGYALVLSAGLASLLGLAYWIVAARTYSEREVGLNSAAISMMTLVSTIAQLNLVGGLLRFVPGARSSTWKLVRWSYGISLATSAVLTVVVLGIVRAWVPELESLAPGIGFALWFIVATMFWSIFNLQDAVLTGLRRAIWVPIDNTLFGVVKMVLLVMFATAFARFGIFASWTLGAAISVLVITAVLAFRLIPRDGRLDEEPLEPTTPRAIGRFVAADYIGGLSWTAASNVIPILVIHELGSVQNAYYALAWVMVAPLYLVSANTASSLVVAIVTERERARESARRVFVQTARLVVPAALVLALAAPLLLAFFGKGYEDHGTTTMRLLALSAVPSMVTTLYLGVWRAERRLSLLIWVRVSQYGAVIVFSAIFLTRYGIVAPAVAWLAVQTVFAAALLVASPQVLVGLGSAFRTQQLVLRGTLLARNAAAGSGILALSQTRRRRTRKRTIDEALLAIPRILAELPADAAMPLRAAWVTRFVPPSVTDKPVAFVGPAEERPQAVVKLAPTPGTARALAKETSVLTRLGSDRRLEPIRPLLPKIIAVGALDGVPYRVETALHGVLAAKEISSRPSSASLLDRLARPIIELHQRSAVELEVGEFELRRWVDEPLAVLDALLHRTGSASAWQLDALDALGGSVRGALAGSSVRASWTHGDYGPGNVLLDPESGEVSGIVDWESAAEVDLPALDLVQLILATRVLELRREYGQVVTRALNGEWEQPEAALVDRSRELMGGDVSVHELVLLAWLRHISSVLIKAPGYADNWLWTKSNLESVLAAIG